MNLHQIFHQACTFLHRNYLDDSEGHSYGQVGIGSFITTTPTHASHLVQSCFAKHQITQVTQPPYSPDLVPCDFKHFPKTKITLERKDFRLLMKFRIILRGS